MKACILALAVCALGSAPGPAEKLPVLLDKPFLGCFVGFQGSRDFEFVIGGDGEGELFFEKDRKRLTTFGCTLKLYYVLEEWSEEKNRWSYRTMKKEGFETTWTEGVLAPLEELIKFTATYTGDTRVEITHLFKKDGVEITSRIVESKSRNRQRVGVKVIVGDLYRHVTAGLEEREVKAKIRDSQIAVWPVGGARSSSRARIKLRKGEVKLPEEFPKGARKFSLESERYADHEFTLSTANEEFGKLEFRQKKILYHGFEVLWWPEPAKSEEKDCRLVIEVK